MRDELNQARGDCILRGQDRLQQRVSIRTPSHPTGADEVGEPKWSEVPEYCQVSGDWHQQGPTLSWAGRLSAVKVQG